MNKGDRCGRLECLCKLYGGDPCDYEQLSRLETILTTLSDYITFEGNYIQTTMSWTAPRYWRINHIQTRTDAIQKAIIHYHKLNKDI